MSHSIVVRSTRRAAGCAALVVLLLFVPQGVALAGAPSLDWQSQPIEFEEGIYEFSLAVDSQGRPHVAFYSEGREALVYATGVNGWDSTVVDGGTLGDNVGGSPSIALDSADRPHISYYDQTNDNPKYASYYDGSWHTQTVDAPGDVGRSSSLVLDGSDNPHIAYHDVGNGHLKYAYYDGVWHRQTVDSADSVGQNCSLVLDSLGRPRIAYLQTTFIDQGPGNRWYEYGLRWASKDVSWNAVTLEHDAYLPRGGRSVALDGDDRPRIVYQDEVTDEAKYRYFDGAWQTETVPFFGGAAAGSIVVDADGRVHASYVTDGCAWYAVRDGTWALEGADCPSPAENTPAGFSAFDLAPDGTPHIAYSNFSSPGLVHVWGRPSPYGLLPELRDTLGDVYARLGPDGMVSHLIDDAKDDLHGDHNFLKGLLDEIKAALSADGMVSDLIDDAKEDLYEDLHQDHDFLKAALSVGGSVEGMIDSARNQLDTSLKNVRDELVDTLADLSAQVSAVQADVAARLDHPDVGLPAIRSAVADVDAKLLSLDVQIEEGELTSKGAALYVFTSFAGQRAEAEVVRVEAGGAPVDPARYHVDSVSPGLIRVLLEPGTIPSKDALPVVIEVRGDAHGQRVPGAGLIVISGAK
ncbi:MAG: hypothetical protein JXA74_07515 [Anaerolineae bacterium]|nr:hypothetical protein [Anaerolineae bacterium]